MAIDLKQMGRRVAASRTLRGWSQKELAEQAGLTQATVARVELGQKHRVALDTLYKIAEALEEDTDYLLGRRDKVRA
jgi:HTH-type transcriptional regulator / antitoxin HipB